MSRREYPKPPTAPVVDEYHGRRVSDPFRPLEDADAPATREWIEAQNALTERWLAQVPGRSRIGERIAALWDHPRRGAPWRRGSQWFQMRNTGLQDQDVLWTMETPQAEGRVLLDPNHLSVAGTVALTATSVSDDGRLLAYATSASGSDWMTWRVREVTSGEDLDDLVEWSKFSSAAWLPDGSGFFYAAYDPPPPDATYQARNLNQRLYLHRLGNSQDKDEVVYERPDQPEWGFSPHVTHDGRYLILHVWQGTQPWNRIHYLDLRGNGEVEALLDEGDARYELTGTQGPLWYFLTDRDAPNGRVVAIDVRHPQPPHWREVVAESSDALERTRLVGGRLVGLYLHHARHRLRLFHSDGRPIGEGALPDVGAVEQLTGREVDEALHLTLVTFTRPAAVLRCDIATGSVEEVSSPGLDVGEGMVTEQVFVASGDGVKVPLFLVHREDITATGDVPTLLWGYGGFRASLTPTFKVPWSVWLERGGLLAVANLRGGGEYGQPWHDAGRLANKQNVFDDFIACAEWLTGPGGWTRSGRLAMEGRSNGGLLVAACMTQRPELFGACVIEVGVLDMLRFHRFTIGWAWASDYGSADDPEQFEWLMEYSPLHNLEPGTCYPPTLVTTGDHDDRVVPGHSFKFVAALQAAQGCDSPVLVRIDTSAGHGMGKPTSKSIEERADVLAFCLEALRATG
ncbi:MAG: prolyl oligopeptidase family protein [Nitriliruptorales bacterium]